jgi:hypothetical protein
VINERYWVRPKEWPTFGIGHNGGPPLDDDEPPGKVLLVRHAWKTAHAEVWKTPPRDVLLFRLRRAEAAGLSYEEYMLRLLDTGRYPQAGDKPGDPKDDAK